MADQQSGSPDQNALEGTSRQPPKSSRMPEGSRFYERIVPALLIILGVGTVTLILFAAGVLLGIVPFD